MAHRFSGKGQPYEALTVLGKHGSRWAGRARFVPDMLGEPLRWRKPQRIFVNSMSDLFHDDVTNEQIAAVFAMMLLTPRHTYQVLTKRPERMRELLTSDRFYDRVLQAAEPIRAEHPELMEIGINDPSKWPAKWIWLGVSVEDQQRADERIPLLLQTPAAVRFVSAEPLLDQLDLSQYLKPSLVANDGERLQHPDPRIPSTGGTWEWGLDWVIVGGESGPGARPCDVQWIRDVVTQCAAAKVSCFVKQLGSKPCELDIDETCGVEYFPTIRLRDRKGGDMSEWSPDLRVREFPR